MSCYPLIFTCDISILILTSNYLYFRLKQLHVLLWPAQFVIYTKYLLCIVTKNYLYFRLKQLHAQLMPAQFIIALKHGNYWIMAGQCISQSISTFKELVAFLYIWTSVIAICSMKYNLYMQLSTFILFSYIFFLPPFLFSLILTFKELQIGCLSIYLMHERVRLRITIKDLFQEIQSLYIIFI